MSSIIILTQNKVSIEFWQSKLVTVSEPIFKVRSALVALQKAPSIIIVDDYFMNQENANWMRDQVSILRSNDSNEFLICLSPRFTSMRKSPFKKDDNIYYHHFNQSFIDEVSNRLSA